MLWKRIVVLSVAATALGAAAPAFADRSDWTRDWGARSMHYAPRPAATYPRQYVITTHRPVVAYRAPVYYARPAYAYRAPAYYGPPAYAYRGYRNYDHRAGGALAGAVAGALIGGSVSYGDQQGAGILIGSVLGAVIGHELAGGH